MEILNLWHSDSFGGDKFFGFSETNSLGGINDFLGYSFIFIGVISIILSFVFLFRKLQRPRGILRKRIEETNLNLSND